MNPGQKNLFFKRALGSMILLVLLMAIGSARPVLSGQARDWEEEGRKIAAELRCVVCQNLSVADSPSEMAQQMRAIILDQLRQGKTSGEIKAYFVSKYGEWVLLSPPARGFSLLVWLLPFAVLGIGLLVAAYFVHRWVRNKRPSAGFDTQPDVIRRLRQEVSAEGPTYGESRDDRFCKALLAEQARLRSDIQEFEFDFQAGKLSGTDYDELRRDIERQASAVERELASLSPQRIPPEPSFSEDGPSSPKESESSARRAGIPVWQLATGALFLLVLGIALGTLLTKSLKPRSSEQDSITGDFLTGTSPLKDLASLLADGRSAFERQEWPVAIEIFRKILEADANHVEANSYMGLVLAQAGHVDEALAAFDRALATDPNFPIALWGKGLLLYRAKEDTAHARELFERLVGLMPAGEERKAVQKILGEMTTRADGGKKTFAETKLRPAGKTIRGTVSLGPNLNSKPPGSAVLFIIARSSGSSGPPLAVKKIAQPAFPIRYILGPEDSMIPGRPLAGKVFVSARLDQDGNPTTRNAGDWVGEYGKNPVELGTEGVDITLVRAGQP